MKREVPVAWGKPLTGRMELSPPSQTFQGLAFLEIGLGVILGAVGVLILVVDNPIGRLLTLLGLPLYELGSVEAGVGVMGTGLSLLALGGFSLARSAALRCALTVYEQGIVVSRKGREQVIPYAGVREFSVGEYVSSGLRLPLERLFLVDFTGEQGRTRIAHSTREGTDPDPFVAVLEEIRYQLASTMEARLAQGGVLRGRGWVLDSRGLHLGRRGTVRLEDVALVEGFEGAVSFWKRGEPMPFFSTSVLGPNALLLHVLARRKSDGRPPDLGPLGRVIHRLTLGTSDKLLRGTFVALYLWLLSAIVVSGRMGGEAVALLGVLAIPLGFFLAHGFRELRVHERGISQKFFRTRGLRYSDIRTFSFGEIRRGLRELQTMGGQPTLRLRLDSGPGGEVITHTVGTGHARTDALLESTREVLTRLVAHRLLARLQLGEEVTWGAHARFTPQGLVTRLAGTFTQGEARLIPYDTPLKNSTEQGDFLLFVGDEVEPALILDPGAPNFHAGWRVLTLLRSSEARDFWNPAREPAYRLEDRLSIDSSPLSLPKPLPRPS